ncbi:LysR family transcriptional regulator [Pseudomonas japonica]|uniref:LysR family transcriptional regulator n=1 Tax=Pseudomonas japonica TaxID=256466 RepID=UPI0015E448F1|nr:LysR family transcriptional regulator [Pseudomonas japonica]MBA1289702.1 LysR family transcriptional regulator [Pseudomonas japonica]
MTVDLNDVRAFIAIAQAKGFRDAARRTGASASKLSDALRRLEAQLQVRLLHRSTRSVVLTEAGARLLEALGPAIADVTRALDAVRGTDEQPAGTLKLNVPVVAARLILPRLLPGFLARYPAIKVEVIADDRFVDVLASGCDAGIRYEEGLQQDMVAVPIGPRTQRFALAAAPAYLERHGIPQHPDDLAGHACLRGRFASGAVPAWLFEQDGQQLEVEPEGPLEVQIGGAAELLVDMGIAGSGLLMLFEDWLRPHFERGALVPVMEAWWPTFSGPFLYYPGRRHLPAPLRAFVDYIRAHGPATGDLKTLRENLPPL